MRIDGTTADAVKALELSRSAEIVSLDIQIQRTKRQNDGDKDRGSYRDHHQGKNGYIVVSVKGRTTAKKDGCLPLAELTKSMLNVRLCTSDITQGRMSRDWTYARTSSTL